MLSLCFHKQLFRTLFCVIALRRRMQNRLIPMLFVCQLWFIPDRRNDAMEQVSG